MSGIAGHGPVSFVFSPSPFIVSTVYPIRGVFVCPRVSMWYLRQYVCMCLIRFCCSFCRLQMSLARNLFLCSRSPGFLPSLLDLAFVCVLPLADCCPIFLLGLGSVVLFPRGPCTLSFGVPCISCRTALFCSAGMVGRLSDTPRTECMAFALGLRCILLLFRLHIGRYTLMSSYAVSVSWPLTLGNFIPFGLCFVASFAIGNLSSASPAVILLLRCLEFGYSW